MDFALFSSEGVLFLLRWIHFLAGVTWIGILYYFNFIQGSFFKETDASTKTAATQKLVPRALWWFRWGAMFTFISGLFILSMKGHQNPYIYTTAWGVCILIGAALGTLMWFNVWFVIWPAQKVVIQGAVEGKALPGTPEKAARALTASRTNTLFSFPMLFFMGGASHLPLVVTTESFMPLIAVFAVIIGLIELNALKGKTGPMTSVKGVIHCGLGLTVVMYFLLEWLTK